MRFLSKNFHKNAFLLGSIIPFFIFIILLNIKINKSVNPNYSSTRVLSAHDYIEEKDEETGEVISYKKIEHKYLSDVVLVKFKEDNLKLDSFSGGIKKAIFEISENTKIEAEINLINLAAIKLNANENVFDKINELEKRPDVEYAEPNYIYELYSEYTPNDPLFNTQYSLNNTGQTINSISGTSGADMDVLEMWEIEDPNGSEVIVGVIDSGLSINHPDIKNNMVKGYKFEGLGTGLTSVSQIISGDTSATGLNYIDVSDVDGHGTHVAGIIASEHGNSYGTSGISRYNKIKVMPFDISTPYEYYSFLDLTGIIMSIEKSEETGLKIINLSLGTPTYSQAFEDALRNFSGLAVVAAGNESNDTGSNPAYPCNYDLDNILCVANTDQNDNLASTSNYGDQEVDVGAPGTNINSLDIGKQIFYEDFNQVSSYFSAFPESSWDYYMLNNGNTVVNTTPFNPYNNNEDSNLQSTNLLPNSYEISNAVLEFYQQCQLEKSLTPISLNGIVDDYYIPDSDYLDLYSSSDAGSSWDLQLRIKNISSSGAKDTPYYGQKIGFNYQQPIDDFRLKYNFRTNSSNDGDYSGCYIDYIKLTDRDAFDGNSFLYQNGTSMAAPNVAGVAAMLLSYDPTLTVSELKSIIMNTGDSLSSLEGKTVSGKRVNAYNAYNSLIAPIISQVTPVTTPTNDSTPNYTFTSNEAGTITYQGSCSSTTTSAVVGNNTITFNTLQSGTYSDCTITVTDSDGNVSNTITVNTFVVDLVTPILTEVTQIGTTFDPTPNYTFNSTEEGTITYGNSDCDSSTTSAVVGNNTITFNPIASGTYSNCTIVVTDSAGNNSNTLTITSFTIEEDTTPPIIQEVTPIGSTNDLTPNYTFSSNEEGTIAYGGSCSSSTTVSVVGNNTITLNKFNQTGTYSDCTITVTDYFNNVSDTLTISEFTILEDSQKPVLQEISQIGETEDKTPNYTFSTDEIGDITYGGSCSSSTTTATPGNNTITLNALSEGTYSNCTITVTDYSENSSDPLSITQFEILANPPVLQEITPIGETFDTSPDYTFSSDEEGTISYGGSCNSSTTLAQVGNNTITFNTLSIGTYSNCTITVTDENQNSSTPLQVSPFSIKSQSSSSDNESVSNETSSSTKMTLNKKPSGKYEYGTKVKLELKNGSYIEYRWDKKDEWKRYKSKNGLKLPEGESTLYWKVKDGGGDTIEERSKDFLTHKSDPINNYRGTLNKEVTSIKLQWSSSDPDIEKVRIYRSNTQDYELSEDLLIGENDPDDFDFTDSSVPYNDFYYYKIVAYNDENDIMDYETIGSWLYSVDNRYLASGSLTNNSVVVEYESKEYLFGRGSVLGETTRKSEENVNKPIVIFGDKNDSEKYISDNSILRLDRENNFSDNNNWSFDPILLILAISLFNTFVYSTISILRSKD